MISVCCVSRETLKIISNPLKSFDKVVPWCYIGNQESRELTQTQNNLQLVTERKTQKENIMEKNFDSIDNTTAQGKIYQMITDRILSLLEQGTIPWHKPWNGGGSPKNLISKKNYRGINNFLLSCAPYKSPYFLTFNQIKEKGGTVRKGEKGLPVIFWKPLEFKDKETEKTKKIFMLKYYTVFNAEQCDNIKTPESEETPLNFNPISECENILNNMPQRPVVEYGGKGACYQPSTDKITMPDQQSFKSEEEFYSTLFHEIIHSTGHQSRVNREGVTTPHFFGSHEYSKEELVAEFGASFLCGNAGIENRIIDNSAAYIQSWSKKLRDNNKWLICAASQAQKAADFVLGISSTEE